METPPLQGRRVSPTNEWAGPCPFGMGGDDRFHWWPDKGWWCCRKDCPACPGQVSQPGDWGRWGHLDERHQTSGPPAPAVLPPSMDDAVRYARLLDAEALAYLKERGITPASARRWLLGRRGNRLTIPNIVTNSPTTCVGIKCRWIGEPPEDFVPKYVMIPGSRGATLFGADILRRRVPYALIVEAPLDVILLRQMGILAVAPFGGGGVWRSDWGNFLKNARAVFHVADHTPGANDDGVAKAVCDMQKAEGRRELLGRGRVVLPPGGAKDVGEAYQQGENLARWVESLVSEGD